MSQTPPAYPPNALFLGTAGWGQKVDKSTAYELLSAFYGAGYRWVDTATNYPINRNPEDYSQTIHWLSVFASEFPGMKVFVKAGSTANLGGPENLINPSYFDLLFDMLEGRLAGAFAGIGVHWDNTTVGDDRHLLIEFFARIQKCGYEIGLSGIKDLDMYSQFPLGKSLPWLYQVNFSLTRGSEIGSEVVEIKKHFSNARICGYNALGGLSSKGLLDGDSRMAILANSVGEFAGKTSAEILKEVISQSRANGADALIIGPTNRAQFEDWDRAIKGYSHD